MFSCASQLANLNPLNSASRCELVANVNPFNADVLVKLAVASCQNTAEENCDSNTSRIQMLEKMFSCASQLAMPPVWRASRRDSARNAARFGERCRPFGAHRGANWLLMWILLMLMCLWNLRLHLAKIPLSRYNSSWRIVYCLYVAQCAPLSPLESYHEKS